MHVTEVRIWIESLAVRVACERALATDFDELNRLVDAAEKAHLSGDYEERGRLNFQFHRTIARASGNGLFVALLDSVLAVVNRFVAALGPLKEFDPSDRRRLVQYLSQRNATAAVAEMEALLLHVHKTYLSRRPKSRKRPALPRKE